jgi:ZIP family zinc transporter
MTLAEGNVAVAFGITFASGAATMIGASAVFFPKLVQFASRRLLAGALGFSAGVMIYISFVDIFQKSVDAFESFGMDESQAYGFATLYLFLGILVMKVSSFIPSLFFYH